MGEEEKPLSLPFPALKNKRRGKDEMNLAEFPLGSLTDKEDPSRHTATYLDTITDKRLPEPFDRKIIVTSSQYYGGLPTAYDQDILLGLVNLTKTNNDFTNRKVYFTRHQLIELLGLPDKGGTYKRIARSFHKWKGVSVHYEDSWWKNGEQEWSDEGFSFIDHFKLFDKKALQRRQLLTPKQFEFPFSYFTWGEAIFKSFKEKYLRTLDLETYLALELPTTKRIFRFLGKRFYLSKKQRFTLHEFAFDKVGLSRCYEGDNAQIERKLNPAFKELERIGFLKKQAKAERYFGRGRLREVCLIAAEVSRSNTSKQKSDLTNEQENVRLKLIDRGVHENKALELVEQILTSKILEQIESFDWLCGTSNKPSRPTGYLIKSIREEYAVPDGFIPIRVVEEQKLQNQQKQRAKLKAEKEEYKKEEERILIAERFWNELTPKSREYHELQATKCIDNIFPNGLSVGPARDSLLCEYALKQLEPKKTQE